MSSLDIYLGPDDQNQQVFRNVLEKGGRGGCRDVLEILDGFWNVDIWESNFDIAFLDLVEIGVGPREHESRPSRK